MRQHIDEGIQKLPDISGELTAAVLLIPVSLAFQDFAHALVRDPHFFGGSWPVLPYLQLAAFIVLSLISVTVLSMAMLYIANYDHVSKGVLLFCLLSYVVMIAVSGALADQQANGDSIRGLLVGSALPVVIVGMFLLEWNHSQKFEWQLMMNALAILCILFLITPG